MFTVALPPTPTEKLSQLFPLVISDNACYYSPSDWTTQGAYQTTWSEKDGPYFQANHHEFGQ
jgi:hypothetical protein